MIQAVESIGREIVVGGVVSAWEVREWNEVELADLPS